ncbi:MAG: bifunctional serine/threonine-protein kinase/formylglycine-generating enzyme family protein [Planctomycetota bacterium]|jgi:hypothetical protein
MASRADENLYDAYLNSCLEGVVREPESFFRDHPGADSKLRDRVETLFRFLCEDAGAAPRAAEEGLPFERLGEFRLLQPLDAGGMGTIYLAEQESLGRVVALKVIRPELQTSVEAARRFEREAQSVARLRHKNIVTVHGAGTDQGVRYLAMELVQGRRLDDVLAAVAAGSESIPVPRILKWVAKLARALDYAHRQGIVHRDVKPSNIRITPEDEPLLLDFGVAHEIGTDLTLTTSFTGSPPYATPEQIQPGQPVDGRTDVYALGVTLYQCLTGKVPFSGARVEEVFHRILTEDPLSPRRLNRTVGRELETVTLTAMEKRPAARYPTAAAFADDLEALLEFRPVRARPPRPLARAYKWARRRPAIAVGIAAGFVLLALLLFQGWAAAQAQQEEARRLVAQARATLETYREERKRTSEIEREFAKLERSMYMMFFTPEQDERFAAKEGEVKQRRRRREEVFYEVLDLLRRAEQLDADVPDTDAARLELYIERWQQAKEAQDAETESFYQGLVQKGDPDGRAVRDLYGAGRLRWTSNPANATAHLFRFRNQSEIVPSGEHRLVPVPWRGDTPVPPGTFCLRVTRGAGDVEVGDLILEVAGHPIRHTVFVEGEKSEFRAVIEAEEKGIRVAQSPADLAEQGGVEARVYRDGEVRTIPLQAGLQVRTTAVPLFLSAASRLEAPAVDLDPGSYLLVLRHPGYDELRYSVKIVRKATTDTHVRLLPVGTTPLGFIYVPQRSKQPGFWIMEREVSVREYFEFLNAPETLADIASSNTPIRVPRFVERPKGLIAPTKEGRFELRDYMRQLQNPVAEANPDGANWPILCVSWGDAVAYANWKGKKDGRAYGLPTETQWLRAAFGVTNRLYVFGSTFRPKWACSNFSRPVAHIQPLLRYPIDESLHGVFDMAGSASEWLADPHKNKNMIQHAGGSWGHAQPHLFKIQGGSISGGKPDWTKGFRLAFAEQ